MPTLLLVFDSKRAQHRQSIEHLCVHHACPGWKVCIVDDPLYLESHLNHDEPIDLCLLVVGFPHDERCLRIMKVTYPFCRTLVAMPDPSNRKDTLCNAGVNEVITLDEAGFWGKTFVSRMRMYAQLIEGVPVVEALLSLTATTA
jgi:hypothetical protein